MFLAKDFRAMARNKLKGHWLVSILVTLVASLLGGVTGSNGSGGAMGASGGSSVSQQFSGMDSFSAQGSVSGELPDLNGLVQTMQDNPLFTGVLISVVSFFAIVGIVMFVIGGAVELGHDQYYVDLCNNRNPAFGVLFSRFNIFLKALLLRLFMSLFIFLWTLLFIIPGIIAAYRYSMAPFIMAQNPDIGVREAVNRSKAMMAGRKWRFFCLGFSFIGWHILACLTLGVGYLWLSPYIQAANAAFYLDASGQGVPLEPQPQA